MNEFLLWLYGYLLAFAVWFFDVVVKLGFWLQ